MVYQFLTQDNINNELFRNGLYKNNKKSGRAKLCKVIGYNSRTKLEWYLYEKNISLLEFNTDSESSNNGFDILIYTIKKRISTKLVSYIIKRAPYLDVNYGCIENSHNFNVPLFAALGNSDFDMANLLIKNGANVNFIFQFTISEIHKDDIPYIREDFKYCEKVEYNEFDSKYYRIIYADALRYLCEVDRLNQKNLDYLIKNGYDITNINIDFIDKLKKHNKEKYITMINDSIHKKMLEMIEE